MKRFITFCLAALMAFSLTVTAFAAESEGAEKNKKAQDTEAAFEDMQSKFDALSDSEKQALYDLSGNIADAQILLIEKYRDLGLIDESEAEEIVNMTQEMNEKSESDGIMPGGFRPRPHHELPGTRED